MASLIEYKVPYDVLIIDGQIRIEIPEYQLTITAKVKQVKGRGTADADKLTILNHYHIDLLELLSTTKEDYQFTVNQILSWMQEYQRQKGVLDFNPNHWRRPISELFRKQILLKSEGKNYTIDKLKAAQALETRRF